MSELPSNEEAYQRRLLVHKSKRKDPFKDFQSQKMKERLKDSKVVMDNIMKHYSAQIKSNS
jgi:hypothetical protein